MSPPPWLPLVRSSLRCLCCHNTAARSFLLPALSATPACPSPEHTHRERQVSVRLPVVSPCSPARVLYTFRVPRVPWWIRSSMSSRRSLSRTSIRVSAAAVHSGTDWDDSGSSGKAGQVCIYKWFTCVRYLCAYTCVCYLSDCICCGHSSAAGVAVSLSPAAGPPSGCSLCDLEGSEPQSADPLPPLSCRRTIGWDA